MNLLFNFENIHPDKLEGNQLLYNNTIQNNNFFHSSFIEKQLRTSQYDFSISKNYSNQTI